MPNTTPQRHLDTVLELEAARYIDRRYFWPCNPVTTKILIVVDGPIGFSTTGFGLGLLVDTLRAPYYGFARFEVDLATRDGASPTENATPGDYETRYDGFEFTQTHTGGTSVIEGYDQIWLFGFHPGNDAGPDENIEKTQFNPPSGEELVALTQWMDAGGGVLAMGDHDYLGATMCHKIARVGTMRRWTNAQGVPPIGGLNNSDTHLRHDTNQPQTPGQLDTSNPAVIPFGNQGDVKPQPTDVKRYDIGNGPLIWQRSYEPHPILCSRKHGLINILPDHPHEGWVYEDGEIDAAATYVVKDSSNTTLLSQPEYPSVGGTKPTPEAIAWAHTTPDPPYNLAKGPSPHKRFAVVGAYDGHKADVGRVVVDSTWHHWFSENLVGMKADTTTNHYERLQDYFRNVGVWLATKNQQSKMLGAVAWNSIFTVQAIQELVPRWPSMLIGPTARDIMNRSAGKCTMRQWIWDFLIPEIVPWWKERIIDPQCLSCPPIELFEHEALGALIKEMMPLRERVMEAAAGGKKIEAPEQNVEKIVAKQIERGAGPALELLAKEFAADAKKMAALAKSRSQPAKGK